MSGSMVTPQSLFVSGAIEAIRSERFDLVSLGAPGQEDWERGRIYLPLEDMAQYGYSERDLVDPVYAVKGPYVTMRMKFTEGR